MSGKSHDPQKMLDKRIEAARKLALDTLDHAEKKFVADFIELGVSAEDVQATLERNHAAQLEYIEENLRQLRAWWSAEDGGKKQ